VINSIGTTAFFWCENLSVAGIQALKTKINTENLEYFSNGSVGAAIVAASNKEWIYGAGLVSGDIGTSLNARITSLVDVAFWGCASLEKINLANSSATGPIQYQTFRECKKLKEIHIPAKMTSIEERAFADCPLLTDFYWHNSAAPTSITSDAFESCPNSGTIHTKGNQADAWKAFKDVKSIANWTYIDDIK
jgi:hypothetical protein